MDALPSGKRYKYGSELQAISRLIKPLNVPRLVPFKPGKPNPRQSSAGAISVPCPKYEFVRSCNNVMTSGSVTWW